VTPPAAKPQQMAAAKPAPAKPTAQDLAPSQPQVATKPPAPLGIAHPTAPTAVAPAAPPLKPALKPATEVSAKPAAASGGYLLQIGAYKSEEEARTAWKTYQSKHATLLSGFGPDVQRTTHDDGSTWYRLRIASFADKDTAAALCERLKTQGAACFVAK
jgi:cell division protein FtsN